MWNIVTQVTFKNGGVKVYRDTLKECSQSDCDYYEKYYGYEPYSNPDVTDATVINVFYMEG
jgi:hypothetical protein